MAEDRPLFVARPDDVATLKAHWEAAKSGDPRIIRLQSGFGGGRRALAAEFLRDVRKSGDDALIWRVTCLDQENGLQWLVRMYGSMIAHITSDVLRRGKVEMILNGQLPSQTKRVQGWYQQFVASIKDAKADEKTGQVQLKIPQDNPLIGLAEVAAAIGRKMPVILDLQSPQVVNSVLPAQFIEALLEEAKHAGLNLMVIIHDEPESDQAKAVFPLPLLDLYSRRGDAFQVMTLAPWGEAEANAYLDSKGLTGNGARIAEIAGGRPGFVAELVDILEAAGTLATDLADVTLASLVPMTVEEEDLEVPDAPPEEGKRKHAGPGDAKHVAYFAALLGQAFPSSLVADMGGYDHESVDDLIDAMGTLFEEVQFADDMNTWIYKFARGTWREGIIEVNDTDEGHALARRVGMFMERYLVPRGYGFIAKTARIYGEHGALGRAAAMRSLGLQNDAPDAWGLAYDLIKYYDEVDWPAALRRTCFMSLLDRMVQGGQVAAAEKVHTEATEWATEKEDRDLQAWLLFNGSKLDARRQDYFRARDRANDALTLYAALEAKVRQAEVHNHLATIELQDGNPNAALEQIEKAVELGTVDNDGTPAVLPAVLAHAEFVRGVVARRTNNTDEAIVHFKRANEIAGNTGLAPLALDAGLALGEALFSTRQIDRAHEVLGRVVQLTRQLKNLPRERAASELLAQAEGAKRNFPAALQLASRVLQLSQQLKFEQALAVDLYNVGFFTFATNKPTEALPFFRQSGERLKGTPNHPLVKELRYYEGLANLQAGNLDAAKASLADGLGAMQAAKDWNKLVESLNHLATIEERGGNAVGAKQHLATAMDVAKQANLKEARKNLKKRLETMA